VKLVLKNCLTTTFLVVGVVVRPVVLTAVCEFDGGW
jgi:hypothetical protein